MAPVEKLLKVGFNYRQAAVLQDLETATTKQLGRAGFSPRQVRTLQTETLTMKVLLHGGFTRHQAKLILAA